MRAVQVAYKKRLWSSVVVLFKLSTMFLTIAVFYFYSLPIVESNSTLLPIPNDNLRCSVLDQPLCRNIFNTTAFPNDRMHGSQDEADAELQDFSRLWSGVPCSNAIAYFLCSFYFPFCGKLGESDVNTTLPPCRNLCKAARDGCEEVVEQNTEVGWPPFLDCDNFPERGGLEVCFGPADPYNLTWPLDGIDITESDPTTSPTSAASTVFTTNIYMLIFVLFYSIFL